MIFILLSILIIYTLISNKVQWNCVYGNCNEFKNDTILNISTQTTELIKEEIKTDYYFDDMVPLKRANRNKILFLKTFKTGGSTMSNLFRNYCIKYNKSCVVGSSFWPFYRPPDIKKCYKNAKSWSTHKNELTYDIFTQHTTFHPKLYELINGTEKQIVSIVRYPIDQFVSSWNHCQGHEKRYKMDLSDFINLTYSNKTKYINKFYHGHPRWSLNSQCKVLIPQLTDKGIDKYNNLDKIKSGQWLILILERFYESLLILKYAYDLQWEDLVYIQQKTNKKNDNPQYITTQKDKQKFLEINHCDLKLYNIAYQQFEKRLYEIYKNDTNQIQNDIETMNKVRQSEIKKCQQMSVKSLYCQSLPQDQIAWWLWARNIINESV